MASDLAIQSNQSSMLLRSLVDAGSSDLSYSMPTSYPLMSKEIRELSPKQNPSGSPNNQEVIWDLNKYQYLRDLMIRTQVTKPANASQVGKFYGLTMFSEITLRTNNKIIQTLSDSAIRARVDNLPEAQRLAVLRRALFLVPDTEVVAAGNATSVCTYTPIFSTFFEDVKNNLNLNFIEQFQIAVRFNTAVASGCIDPYSTCSSIRLYAWSYLPDLTYSNFLTAKNHKEGSILNMLCYNTQKQVFALDSTTTVNAKLATNFPVFNIHYAVVSATATATDASATQIVPITSCDLKFGGISVFGTLPSSVVNYEQEKSASKLLLTTGSAVSRHSAPADATVATLTDVGFSTIPFGIESVHNRKYNSGAVSFNNVNVPTLSLVFPAVAVATNYQLECVFEHWQMVSINDLGVCSVSASY